MDVAAYTIPEICQRYGFCRATFYNLEKQGKAPATIKIGRSRRVTVEEDAAWRRRMESDTSRKAAA